jgi:hypothetical protein
MRKKKEDAKARLEWYRNPERNKAFLEREEGKKSRK